MLSQLLKSKLHHLRVTSCAPEYQGSLLIDDRLIVMTFALFTDAERRAHVPTVVVLDADNKPVRH